MLTEFAHEFQRMFVYHIAEFAHDNANKQYECHAKAYAEYLQFTEIDSGRYNKRVQHKRGRY